MEKYSLILNSGALRVKHIFAGVTCTEVVRHITYFLLGCSFHEKSIAKALRERADELDPKTEESKIQWGSPTYE